MVDWSNIELAFPSPLGGYRWGIKAHEKSIAQKYAVIASLNKLANIGYTLPTLSSLTIQAIDAGCHHDVASFCARIARIHRNDVVKSKSNS